MNRSVGALRRQENFHGTRDRSQVGIDVVSSSTYEEPGVYVDASAHGRSFYVLVLFVRPVNYASSGQDQRSIIGSTWHTIGVGTSGPTGEEVMATIDQLLDELLNGYLKANQVGATKN